MATSDWEIGSNPWGLPDGPEPIDTNLDPVAQQVLDTFNIPNDGQVGGDRLAGLDIQHMNAISAMKLSLFAEFLKSEDNIYKEVYADEDGIAKAYEIGSEGGTGLLNVRYTIPTRNVTDPVEQVKVVGFDPPPYLYVGDTYDIFAEFSPGDPNDYFQGEKIQPIHLLVEDTCYEEVFDRYSYFCYRTPIYASKWNDQIDSLFEENYDETVIAWIHDLEGMDSLSDRGSINFSEYTLYPLEIEQEFNGDFPVTLFPINIEYVSDEEARCWIKPDETRVSYSLDISDDKYKYDDPDYDGQSLSDVEDLAYFIITGYKVTYATSWPARTLSGRNIGDQHVTYVERKDTKEAIALQEGVDYTYWFDSVGCGGGDACIQISAGYVQKYSWEEFGLQNYYTDWEYPTGYITERGFLWPRLGGTGLDTGGLGTAMWVTGMYLVLRRKLSSVIIYDPDGAADDIMDASSYEVTPIIQRNPNPPTCGRGIFNKCVDWATTVFDTDPTTGNEELFKTSDLAQLNDALAQGVSSISIDAPYLITEDDVRRAADNIYNFFPDTSTTEKVYVCGPTETPILGETHEGGVINSISYSYNDQSAYTISVTVGSKYSRDLPSSSTNIWMMETETIKRRATITQDAGDGLFYVARVEGLGEFIAVNTVVGVASPKVNDVVDVEINNIPMGWA